MLKKIVLLMLSLIGAFALSASAWWSSKDITMLVVPRDPMAIRIAQDMSQLRPVLLVTYKQLPDGLFIHAWNGKSWVSVSPEDYVSGAFFANRPSHTIIVQSESETAPELLVPDGTWCAEGNRLTSTDPRVLLHLLGRYFDVSYQTWKDLTWRYKYTLEEINPGLQNIPWWHFRGNEIYQARMKRNLAADLEKWFFLDITPPPPPEPVAVEEEIKELPAVEIPAGEEMPAEDSVTTEVVEGIDAPVLEEAAAPVLEEAAIEEPVVTVDADPFSEDEIPPAAIIEPAPKKAWWKLF